MCKKLFTRLFNRSRNFSGVSDEELARAAAIYYGVYSSQKSNSRFEPTRFEYTKFEPTRFEPSRFTH